MACALCLGMMAVSSCQKEEREHNNGDSDSVNDTAAAITKHLVCISGTCDIRDGSDVIHFDRDWMRLNWEGDRLASIEYTESNTCETFAYSADGRIERAIITQLDNSQSVGESRYIYENGRLKSIFTQEFPMAVDLYLYYGSDGRIEQIDNLTYISAKSDTAITRNMFEYDGGRLSGFSSWKYRPTISDTIISHSTITSDSHPNPLYNILTTVMLFSNRSTMIAHDVINPHNVVEMQGDKTSISRRYTYDADGYPATVEEELNIEGRLYIGSYTFTYAE